MMLGYFLPQPYVSLLEHDLPGELARMTVSQGEFRRVSLRETRC